MVRAQRRVGGGTHSSGKDATAQAKTAHIHKAAATPICVVSFTPALHTHGVNGADPIRVIVLGIARR